MLVLRDITDRILLEESLIDSQAHAHLGSWAYSLLTKEIKWSAETFRIFDLSELDVKPSLKIYFSMVHEEDRDLLKTAITLGLLQTKSHIPSTTG